MTLWICLAISYGIFVSGEPDDYRTSDMNLKEAKDRLLGLGNPDNPIGEPGGIRSRTSDQNIAVSGLISDLRPVTKGFRALSRGWTDDIYPKVSGLAAQDKLNLQKLKALDNKIERYHERADKQINRFSRDWQGNLLKKFEQDPSSFNSVFDSVSQAFINEYKQLTRTLQTESREMNKAGQVIARQNVGTQKLQNKSMATIERYMKMGSFGIEQLLNRKALPLLIGTKYRSAADVANIGKQTLDAVDDLKDNVLVDLAKQGSTYMDKSSDTLKLSAQNTINKAGKKIQRSLTSMRSDLNRQSMKYNTMVNRNFSKIDDTLLKSQDTIARARVNGTKTLQKHIDMANQINADFRNNVLNTANDLNSMLSSESGIVDTIKQQSKLDAEQINTQFSSKISSLSGTLKNAGSTNTGYLNNVQSQISGAYTSGASEVASSLSQQTRGRAAAMLSDASDQSEELAGMFEQVSSQAQALGGELGTKVGVANAGLSNAQDTLSRRTGDLASSTMAEIDDATAENEGERANLISRFENGASQTSSGLKSSIGGIGSSMNDKSASLAERTLSANQAMVSDLAQSQTSMSTQAGQLKDMQTRLVNLPQDSLKKLDGQNEQRIQTSIGELNQLRQLTANRGDQFQSAASKTIADLVSASLASGKMDYQGANMTNLTAQSSAIKNASIGYKASVNSFETAMDAELSKAYDSLNTLQASSSVNKEIGQIVAHQQSALADKGRLLIRDIYNKSSSDNSISRFLVNNPRLDVSRSIGNKVLNTSVFDKKYDQTLSAQLKDLGAKRAQTRTGIEQFAKFLESVKAQVANRLNMETDDGVKIAAIARMRDASVAEVAMAAADMNHTIDSQFQRANESIANKTYNFYKQFQTASIVADSLVQGFAEYVDKMISYEKASAAQREATQASLVKSIQEHMSGPPLFNSSMNASEIDRVNQLVQAAMDSSDQSAEGIRKRKAAQEALVNMMGVDAANALQNKYKQLSGNADALSASIEASIDEMSSDRVGGLEASKLGLDGVSGETQLFAKQAGGILENQKKNANEIAAKIDELLNGGSFLTNISSQELGAILASVQNSDGVYRSQISAYQDANGASVATLGGVIEAFANLVQSSLNKTTDFLDMMSKNYTVLVKKTDAVTRTPVADIQKDLKKTLNKADVINSTLTQHQLSVGPIEEALQDRLDSLNQRNDEFMASINQQLNQYMATVHQMDGQIAVSRQDGMKKLRSALSKLTNDFQEQALNFQAERVDKSSLLQVRSDSELRSDVNQRIQLIRTLINGK